jgi:hypothetical protein
MTVDKLTEIKIVKMCAFPDFIFVKISTRISLVFFQFCLPGKDIYSYKNSEQGRNDPPARFLKFVFSNCKNLDSILATTPYFECLNTSLTAKVKNIKSIFNAASIHPFTNAAWRIYSTIHIFHLYMNSLCWS